jgi:hypothetical protein
MIKQVLCCAAPAAADMHHVMAFVFADHHWVAACAVPAAADMNMC